MRDSAAWLNITTGAWCYYNNDPALGKIYGKLYNWYAVNDPRGLAPEGWHVSTDEEWKALEMCIGMSRSEADSTDYRGTDQGGKLKSTGTKEAGDGLWFSPNIGATNESGFSALPGGDRINFGTFSSINGIGYWWSSTESKATSVWYRILSLFDANVNRGPSDKESGLSVRCIKD